MKTSFLITFFLVGCFTTVVVGQVKKKAPAKPVTTQTATTSDGRAVILKSDGTWSYEKTGPTANLVTLTGKCRLQLVAGFFPCNSKALFLSRPNAVSHVTFVKVEGGGEMIFDLSGRSDRQPNLENYYLQIDTLSLIRDGETAASDDGMEGECHFRMNRAGSHIFSVKCDVYNRSKGSLYNFYLENITKTDRREME